MTMLMMFFSQAYVNLIPLFSKLAEVIRNGKNSLSEAWGWTFLEGKWSVVRAIAIFIPISRYLHARITCDLISGNSLWLVPRGDMTNAGIGLEMWLWRALLPTSSPYLSVWRSDGHTYLKACTDSDSTAILNPYGAACWRTTELSTHTHGITPTILPQQTAYNHFLIRMLVRAHIYCKVFILVHYISSINAKFVA